jgi:stage V sporulation protein K
MGLLSSGHTVACDRSTLMGQFIGESEQKVREVVESARGGVLFVDEAYSLFADEKDRDFGRHVINCMLPILAEPDPDMIVIFAGYRDKMEELFKVNPGLRDRFPLSLHFDDYSSDELLGIIRHLASTRHFTFAPEAEADVRRIIEAVIAQRDPHFSNARWATNLFELGILRAMAQRVVNALSSAADEETRRSLLAEQETLSLITLDDVRQAETQYLGTMAPRRTAVQRIGFLVQSA